MKSELTFGGLNTDSIVWALMHHTVREPYAEEALIDAILNSELSQARYELLTSLIAADVWTAHRVTLKNLHAQMIPVGDDTTYRISLGQDKIRVLCFGIDSVDSSLNGEYDSVDDLPDWVKERLAVLMVASSEPPTREIEGVGRRISERVFWVFAPSVQTGASTSA
jgi:hypothetical protein